MGKNEKSHSKERRREKEGDGKENCGNSKGEKEKENRGM